MEILQEEHYFYTAWRDKNGDYFLEALCGTVAIFSITVKLREEEIAEYHKNPESLKILAQSITDSPHSYLPRRV